MDMDIVHQNMARAKLEDVSKKAVDPEKENALKEACAGFEAIFTHTMIKSMRATLPGNALFEDSNAQQIYQSMQDQQMAEHLSKGSASVGLKDYLYESLKDTI